jgi:SHS2 domain-containing protein
VISDQWREQSNSVHRSPFTSPSIIRLMPYHYLEEIGTADIAFEATGRDLPELFTAAADATINVMIDNLDSIEPREARQIELSNDNVEMLLFDFLQELIYFKDARRLLLRAREMQIDQKGETYFLKAKVAGERLDDTRHQQRADVKAVTLHGFSVKKDDENWKARVLLDI